MLEDQPIMAFLAITRREGARDFYEGILGLTFIEDSPYALVFDAHGIMLRIQKVERFEPASHTALGWRVTDIRATVRVLAARGVPCMLSVGVPQDEWGIWTTSDGTQIAWFKDPSGNILSLTQFPSP
jgi:predicted enzyme related to lactoylglutathione lyase